MKEGVTWKGVGLLAAGILRNIVIETAGSILKDWITETFPQLKLYQLAANECMLRLRDA